jgi:hypothetical protein
LLRCYFFWALSMSIDENGGHCRSQKLLVGDGSLERGKGRFSQPQALGNKKGREMFRGS